MIKFLTAKDVSELTNYSLPQAYKLIAELNFELKEKGLKTNPGRVNAEYFGKRYGFSRETLEKEVV